MGLRIIRANLTDLPEKVDVIVNSANRDPVYGNGVDRAVYLADGEEDLLKARKQIGVIEYGNVKETIAHNLNAKCIFHAVVPRWYTNGSDGSKGEYELLASCYRKSLSLMLEKRCVSIAFPLLATGVYGFPRKIALQVAVSEIVTFLLEHEGIDVYLVIFDKESFKLASRIWPVIDEYISDNQAVEISGKEYVDSNRFVEELLKPLNMEEVDEVDPDIRAYYDGIKAVFMQVLDGNVHTSFSKLVLQYIDEKDLKDSEFYKAAGIERKTFYAIKNEVERQYKPNTLWGVCFGLQLSSFEAKNLMKCAQYEINEQDKRDQVLCECLDKKIYSIVKVNEILDDKGLPLLSTR